MSKRLTSNNRNHKSNAKKVNETFKHDTSQDLGVSDSRANVSMNFDLMKYKPLGPALPSSMIAPPNIADRIRAAKRLHMTRRDMTEQRIIKNIAMHNNPSDIQNFEVLYISNKNDSYGPDAFANDSRQAFPPL
jgi:hypothetical protein